MSSEAESLTQEDGLEGTDCFLRRTPRASEVSSFCSWFTCRCLIADHLAYTIIDQSDIRAAFHRRTRRVPEIGISNFRERLSSLFTPPWYAIYPFSPHIRSYHRTSILNFQPKSAIEACGNVLVTSQLIFADLALFRKRCFV